MKYDNIPGYPGYFISKNGKVYSRWVPRKSTLGEKWVKRKIRVNNKGRLQVKLRSSTGIKKFEKLNRLEAMVYIPNPGNKPFVCHIDNNPLNNYYKNLYWGTQSENMVQAARDGRTTKLSSDQILEISQNLELGKKRLSEKYNVSLNVIKRIIENVGREKNNRAKDANTAIKPKSRTIKR